MKLFLEDSVSPSHVRHNFREILGTVHRFGNLKWFVMYWPLALRSWRPFAFVTFTYFIAWGVVSSARSKSYLVLKCMNKKNTIRSRVVSTWVMPVSYMRWRTAGSSLPKTINWKYHKKCFMIFLNCKNGHSVYSLYCNTDRLLLKSRFVTGLIGAIVCLLICHIHK